MKIVHTVVELQQELATLRQSGQPVAMIPTMGNLHAGHLALVEAARRDGAKTIVSIFVNPLQFGANEDFGRYPRTLAADAAALTTVACDLLFVPDVLEIYPAGVGQTTINVGKISETLEGAFRPGHFVGVATVVAILLNVVGPDRAYFGQKDYQQLAVIKQMVADLRMPMEIKGMPTIRADDGLALSSRNQYLSATERQQASAIYRQMRAIQNAVHAGADDWGALEALAVSALQAQGFRCQYVAIRAPDLTLPTANNDELVVLVAAFLGSTRLIDNLSFKRSA